MLSGCCGDIRTVYVYKLEATAPLVDGEIDKNNLVWLCTADRLFLLLFTVRFVLLSTPIFCPFSLAANQASHYMHTN